MIMNFRSFIDIFKPLGKKQQVQEWRELGVYNAIFTNFGSDIYKSDIVRACIRPLAEFSSKVRCVCSDKRLERILNNRPNMYMNGKDFLYKIRTRLEIYNNAFIYIERDDRGRACGFYPVPYSWFEAIEYQNGLFIKFYFAGQPANPMALSWDNLAVVRKDYNTSDIHGDANLAILSTLELLNTADEGLANSIKATANLRGILKSTKAMLAPEAIKKQHDDFVKDYLNLENKGGIASLDATQEFTPISMDPSTATYEQMKEIRENVYRYFGVNDDIITANVKTEQLENFYRLKIEPFLVALSRELTSKVYAGKASAYDNYITYEADEGQLLTMTQKMELYQKVVLYGGMTRNEWRLKYMGLEPFEGGDEMIMRLDAAPTDAPRDDKETEPAQDPDDTKDGENNDKK
jgi:HK97 family phage portal protein